ncbi:MAG: hypothetical protein ACXW5W_24865 [Candidatus Binatia bacterium]
MRGSLFFREFKTFPSACSGPEFIEGKPFNGSTGSPMTGLVFGVKARRRNVLEADSLKYKFAFLNSVNDWNDLN